MIRERFKNDVYKRVGGTDLGAKQMYNFVVAEPHNGWRETNINLTSKAYIINCVFSIHTLIAIVPSPPIHVFIHRYG